jgi:hypothetical protein
MQLIKLTLISLVLLGCKKKETKPTTTTTTTSGTVYCFYQTNFGTHAFFYCAKSEEEKLQKINQYQGTSIQFVIEKKSNCNECQ